MLKPFYNKKKNIDNRLLPSATVADAGKVLGVDDEGKYALTEGGGGGKFIVHAEINPGDTPTCDITESAADIIDAIQNGKNIEVRYLIDDAPTDDNFMIGNFIEFRGAPVNRVMFETVTNVTARSSGTMLEKFGFGYFNGTAICVDRSAFLANAT